MNSLVGIDEDGRCQSTDNRYDEENEETKCSPQYNSSIIKVHYCLIKIAINISKIHPWILKKNLSSVVKRKRKDKIKDVLTFERFSPLIRK